MRNCNNCTKDLLCDVFDKLVNQNEEFSTNLNDIKRKKPNDFGHRLPLLYNHINDFEVC